MAKKEKEYNYYKISTFILGGIILLFLIVFLLNLYTSIVYDNGYLQGQQSVFTGILESVNKEGYVSFGENNTSITLVPVQMVQIQREQTILDIMKQIETEGMVQLYNNETEIILVPYQE